jgi:hypothetical protein
MMKMKRQLLVAALLALSAGAARGAPAGSPRPDPERPKWGVGVAVLPSGTTGVFGATEIYAPIQVSPTLRIEPSLGLLTADTGNVNRKDLVLGVGVLVQSRVAAATDLHYGGRLKLGFASVNVAGPGGDDSGNDVVLSGALGGEHWLGDRFSLGLEAQLGYYSLSAPSGDASGLFTAGLVMVRVYL